MALLRYPNPYIIILTRRNLQLEQQLDAEYIRINSRERRWAVKGDLWKRKNEFTGHCHIVGKGPSLDNLTTFPDSQPIFGINEAIVKLGELDLQNQIWGCRQDAHKIAIDIPKNVHMFCPPKFIEKYTALGVSFTVVTAAELKHAHNCLTVVYALTIAEILGFTKAILWCFDACMTGETNYAKCIGYNPGGDPARFLKHRKIIERSKLEIEWRF